jgi:hypothetical protein
VREDEVVECPFGLLKSGARERLFCEPLLRDGLECVFQTGALRLALIRRIDAVRNQLARVAAPLACAPLSDTSGYAPRLNMFSLQRNESETLHAPAGRCDEQIEPAQFVGLLSGERRGYALRLILTVRVQPVGTTGYPHPHQC